MIKRKSFNVDKWLQGHMGELVDKYAGEYIVVAEGRIYRNGTPGQLREKARAEHPQAELLGMRVPHPQDFLCALIIL